MDKFLKPIVTADLFKAAEERKRKEHPISYSATLKPNDTRVKKPKPTTIVLHEPKIADVELKYVV